MPFDQIQQAVLDRQGRRGPADPRRPADLCRRGPAEDRRPGRVVGRADGRAAAAARRQHHSPRSRPGDDRKVSKMLHDSIAYALSHRREAVEYAQQFGRGLDADRTDTFVGMYVNELTLRLRRARPSGRRTAAHGSVREGPDSASAYPRRVRDRRATDPRTRSHHVRRHGPGQHRQRCREHRSGRHAGVKLATFAAGIDTLPAGWREVARRRTIRSDLAAERAGRGTRSVRPVHHRSSPARALACDAATRERAASVRCSPADPPDTAARPRGTDRQMRRA